MGWQLPNAVSVPQTKSQVVSLCCGHGCAYEQQISNYGKKAKFELRGIGDMAEAGGEAQAYGKDP